LRKASLLPFVFVMYAYATGGPFGLEDMVTTSGPGLTLVYQLFIPLFWCIPVSLVSAELPTAIPVEGGFYRWVRAGFADFWGFLAGWWNWTASFLLAAAYAVLFADYLTDYLSFYFGSVDGWGALRDCVGACCGDLLRECAGHPRGGRGLDDTGSFCACGCGRAVRGCGAGVAAQSVFAAGAAACAKVSSFRCRAGVGVEALLGLRATFERGGRSEESAKDLSASARDRGASFGGNVFSADTFFTGGAGKLGEVAHRIFFNRGAAHWRVVAGDSDHYRGHDWECGLVERHSADEYADAFNHGGGRIFTRGVFGEASAVRNAVDYHHRIVGYVCLAGAKDNGCNC